MSRKPLCSECFRPVHKGSCSTNALKLEYGERAKTPPRCPTCNRDHWRFEECALRGAEEDALYLQTRRG